MAKRKKIVEEVPVGETCSNGYQLDERPRSVVSVLTVDSDVLKMLLSGSYRPYQKHDEVRLAFKDGDCPSNQVNFVTMLAFHAVKPGGVIYVVPGLENSPVFKGYQTETEGEMVKITKKA